MELVSQVTTVNFSITFQQLQEKLIGLVVAVQYPEENEELEELNKGNIKDNIELRTIESRILNIFASMETAEEILKTEEILHVLSTSNRLYQQIQERIEESIQKRSAILQRRVQFQASCSKAARLYFDIKKLKQLSPFYQYSLDWFIDLFQTDFNNFKQLLSTEIAKGLPSHLKVVAPLVIA